MTRISHTQAPVEADPTEDIRRTLLAQVNANPSHRTALEAQHGQVWERQNWRETS